jgi:hypothetical protein
MSQNRIADGPSALSYPRLTATCQLEPDKGIRTVVQAASATPRAALFKTVAYSWRTEVLYVEVPAALSQRHP